MVNTVEDVMADPWPVVRTSRLRRKLPLMVILFALIYAVLAGAYVAYYQVNRPEVFRSAATLLIDQKKALFATGDEGIIGKLSELRIKYTSLVGTESFAAPVAQRAALPLSAVEGSLSATADLNTLLITVAANSSSAAQAHTIAATASTYLADYIANEQTTLNVPAKDQVTLSVVTPAGQGRKVAPSNKKAVEEGVAVFVVIAVVGALIADLIRRRRRT